MLTLMLGKIWITILTRAEMALLIEVQVLLAYDELLEEIHNGN
jgi:hypothetical protein